MAYLALASRALVGIIFAVSAFTKLRNGPAFRAFAAWLASVPRMPARGRTPVAATLAATEAAVVLLVALPWTVTPGLALACVTLAVLAAGAFAVARSGASVPCRCFGTRSSSAPLGARHVARNVALCAIAAAGTIGSVSAARATRPSGVALSLGIAAVAALLTLFLDDLAALAADPAGGGEPARRQALLRKAGS